MAEPAVVDTSPLIILSRAGRLELLQMAAESVIIPAAVQAEVAAYGPDDPTVKAIEWTSWLHVRVSRPVPQHIGTLDLGAGESEVIAWALAHPGCEAIIDDSTPVAMRPPSAFRSSALLASSCGPRGAA